MFPYEMHRELRIFDERGAAVSVQGYRFLHILNVWLVFSGRLHWSAIERKYVLVCNQTTWVCAWFEFGASPIYKNNKHLSFDIDGHDDVNVAHNHATMHTKANKCQIECVCVCGFSILFHRSFYRPTRFRHIAQSHILYYYNKSSSDKHSRKSKILIDCRVYFPSLI